MTELIKEDIRKIDELADDVIDSIDDCQTKMHLIEDLFASYANDAKKADSSVWEGLGRMVREWIDATQNVREKAEGVGFITVHVR